MAGKGDNAPVIIIKKKKVIKGGGHHGGAWKVAYADFVTAMMAFFLLMWLLNATTEKERKGLADYFSPTIAVFRETAGGNGPMGGDTTFSEDVLSQNGTGASNTNPTEENRAAGDSGVTPADASAGQDGTADMAFAEVENALRGNSGESTVADELLQHVATRVTDEGLIIDLFDLESSPLFEEGSSVPTHKMEMLLDMVSGVISAVSNDIAISGHTDSRSVDGSDPFILSANRAQLSRQRLLVDGIKPERIARVTGKADRDPVSPDASVFRNRRIEITLLRRFSH